MALSSLLGPAFDVVSGRPLAELRPEDLQPGEGKPVATCRHRDVAAVLFLRRRPKGDLALSVVVLEEHDGAWRLLTDADDEWDGDERGLRWLGWVGAERDVGSAGAVWGVAGPPISEVRAGAATATVARPSGAFVVVTRSDGPSWYETDDRRLTLVGSAPDGRPVAVVTVEAH